MVLVKHPEHGARHVADGEVAALVAAGWTRWPRTAAEKSNQEPPTIAPVAESQAPVPSEPGDGAVASALAGGRPESGIVAVKRGPGRPRKA
jgi:hypothetical protein